ncbi:hypothetical protein [Streptomyces daliensis]
MGIESEQLVFDYLSRVGDLAHGTSMTAAERARLVSGLRGEIDRMRAAEGGAESKAAVRRILGKLGKPEEVVSAANGGPVSPGGLRDVAADGGGGSGSGSGGRGPFGGTGGFGGLGSSLGGLGASLGGLGTSLSSSLSSSLGSSLSGRGARGSQDTRGAGDSGSGPARDGAASRDGDDRAGYGAEDGPSVPFVPDQRDPSDAPDRAPDRAPDPEPERAPTPPPRDYSSPHLAGMDELGPEESNPDWWRTDPSPFGLGDGMGAGPGTGTGGLGEQVPGFVGGIELPEVLKPPPVDGMGDGRTSPGTGPSSPPGPPSAPGTGSPGPPVTGASTVPAAEPGMGGAGGKEAGAGAVAGAALRRLWPGRAGRGGGAAEGSRVGGIVEIGAAVLLVAGALFGSLIPLAVGWLAAWWSPRLSRTEAKWAAAGMPGLVAAGTAVWIWGRLDGRWGDPLAEGGEALQTALSDAFPVLLRIAAVASALFLIWRARRVAP